MNKHYYLLIITLLFFFGCSNMAVKDFKPDTYFSHKGEFEMAMADAIYYGNKKLVREYINTGRGDINRPGKAGFTFLMYAVYIEQYDVAKVLLENGADPNILSVVQHPDGYIEKLLPLYCICQHNWYPIKYMKLLVENGANVNDTILSPLATCIKHSGKDIKKVRYLIDHGAKVNQEFGGFTPIQFAVIAGRLELVDLLWNEYNADPLYVGKSGISLAFMVQNIVDNKLGTPEYVAHAQAIIERLKGMGVKFPVALNPPENEKTTITNSKPTEQGGTL